MVNSFRENSQLYDELWLLTLMETLLSQQITYIF
jgi:hypothetical protein